jgi:hypothetical protein
MLRVSYCERLRCGHSTHAHELSCYFVRKFRTYSTCAEPFPRTSLWPSRQSHRKKLPFLVLKWRCAVYQRQVLFISKSTFYGYISTYFTKAGLKEVQKLYKHCFASSWLGLLFRFGICNVCLITWKRKTNISAKSALCIIKDEFYLEEMESRCFKNKTGWLPYQPNCTLSLHKTPKYQKHLQTQIKNCIFSSSVLSSWKLSALE